MDTRSGTEQGSSWLFLEPKWRFKKVYRSSLPLVYTAALSWGLNPLCVSVKPAPLCQEPQWETERQADTVRGAGLTNMPYVRAKWRSMLRCRGKKTASFLLACSEYHSWISINLNYNLKIKTKPKMNWSYCVYAANSWYSLCLHASELCLKHTGVFACILHPDCIYNLQYFSARAEWWWVLPDLSPALELTHNVQIALAKEE